MIKSLLDAVQRGVRLHRGWTGGGGVSAQIQPIRVLHLSFVLNAVCLRGHSVPGDNDFARRSDVNARDLKWSGGRIDDDCERLFVAQSRNTVKLFESVKLGTPSSATVTVMTLALGPCASPGVQVKTPLVVLMLAPAGALVPKLKVNTFAGTSGSAAVFVTTNVLPSSIN